MNDNQRDNYQVLETAWFNGVIKACDQIILRDHPALEPLKNPHATALLDRLAHLRWMLQESRDMFGREKVERAFQWLGFVQGFLSSAGLTTIQELQLIDILGELPV